MERPTRIGVIYDSATGNAHGAAAAVASTVVDAGRRVVDRATVLRRSSEAAS